MESLVRLDRLMLTIIQVSTMVGHDHISNKNCFFMQQVQLPKYQEEWSCKLSPESTVGWLEKLKVAYAFLFFFKWSVLLYCKKTNTVAERVQKSYKEWEPKLTFRSSLWPKVDH